ncbi:RNA pseudouridine synthase [Billgrantia endophytica]|uniref:Dual-specificity RNA pseudouridine synthase RluF n=1 Tax=Billgrantia endophytica TaxID=2033802 RepID=A0A2N7TWT8_9GAMM|nr:RNA pseudouridine synthase [Halomonas endophytica]PMR72654.1 RNA-binding protein [Halomonas endophytica]
MTIRDTVSDSAGGSDDPAERLSKRLARQHPCSRREAELYIAGGWVSVDGQVIEEPQFKVGRQRVELAPNARAEEIPPATLLLNCPPDHGVADASGLARALINVEAHWDEDPSGSSPLKAHFRGLTPMMPLGRGAGGLLVFTQDRRVERRLSENLSRLEQEVLIDVRGTLDDEQLDTLRHGAAVPGRRLAPCKVSWQSENRLRFAVKGMIPGQLEAMCRAVGLEVVSVKRLRIGGVSLGRVPVGLWRYLGNRERF